MFAKLSDILANISNIFAKLSDILANISNISAKASNIILSLVHVYCQGCPSIMTLCPLGLFFFTSVLTCSSVLSFKCSRQGCFVSKTSNTRMLWKQEYQ